VETKQHILDIAEQIFAERGYAATSLRAVTQAAGVNLAAVNYHFGTKAKLLFAVVERRVNPINGERMRLLTALESAPEPPTLEAVLHAFIAPVFSLGRDSTSRRDTFMRLMGRLYAESVEGLEAFFDRQLGEVFARFLEAFGRRVPELSAQELHWRFHFVLGVLAHPLLIGDRIAAFTDGRCTFDDTAEVVERMVKFAAAGLRCPVPDNAATGERS
jgi:AcrR family transcriptional regulator